MNNGTFDFNLFLKESKDTLLNPRSYFSTLKLTGGIIEPLIKAAIYGTVTGILYLLWGMLRIGVITGRLGFMTFAGWVIGVVIGLFVGGIILLVISSICKGSTDFEANVRVTASTMVIMPISAFLSLFSGINMYFGLIVSLLVFIYSLWLLYHGLVESLKGKPETARIVCYVMIALIALIILLGFSAKSRLERKIERFNKDAKEVLKDLNKN
jgi:hypothetical protein